MRIQDSFMKFRNAFLGASGNALECRVEGQAINLLWGKFYPKLILLAEVSFRPIQRSGLKTFPFQLSFLLFWLPYLISLLILSLKALCFLDSL